VIITLAPRSSEDEREVARVGSSPFVGLNLVLEDLVAGDDPERLIRRGDKIRVIRQKPKSTEVKETFSEYFGKEEPFFLLYELIFLL
jgi:hypothetical protein